ncbi:hypothetical protein GQ44DRAFT_679241 [Phaeosphaeriaceae sp. PMI808]|nr:hypothetical protein GQ44DRAFT_679241 [Phaeosphaeriaceae sp. PMI808]
MIALPPFAKQDQLRSDLDSTKPAASSLPGFPSIDIQDASGLVTFLEEDLVTKELDAVASRLWIMSTQSGANINALTRQRVKGRDVTVTEEPRLHLVWQHGKIFIKPLPRYLLSYDFWEMFLTADSNALGQRRQALTEAALGLVRSYGYLVRHESDFVIAQQDNLRLVPLDVSWAQFCRFITAFRGVMDTDVSRRYQYGELRLSRLNFYAITLFGRRSYETQQTEYSDYYARFYGPILFVFAILTTVLNCMQVVLAVEQLSSKWDGFPSVCRWFSAVCMGLVVAVALMFAIHLGWRISDEWIFAFRSRWRKPAPALATPNEDLE